MKAIYFILIFGLIYCSTDPKQVFDLYYNYEYSLQKDLSLDYTFYAFRLQVNYDGNMDFEIKIPENDYQDPFTLYVFEYIDWPSNEAILNSEYSKQVVGTDQYKEGGYTVYSYGFTASKIGKYFGIQLYLNNDSIYSMNYIIVRVNSSKYRYSNIKDLNFNTDYSIDTSIFTTNNKKIPLYYQIYIRISVFGDDEMEIQLTTHKAYDKNTAFKVDVCQYVDKPTEEQVYYGNGAAKTQAYLENTSDDEEKYIYPFTTIQGINYLSISIINQLSDLDYLNIYIYSKTGMAIAVLIVIIVVPILIVAGIVYFVLRKLQIIK